MSENEDAQRQGAIADAASADAANADTAKQREHLEALRRSIEQAELELKLANVRLERAKIKADVEPAWPWWRNWNVAAITAILAATAPVTAGVVGYFERQKQLALAEQQQKQESVRNSERQLEDIRNRYLDRVRNPAERRRTLRFLIVASDDPKLQEWARREAPIVDAEAKRIDDEIAAKEKIAAESEAAYLAALDNANDPTTRARLQRIAVTARQAADKALDQITRDPGQASLLGCGLGMAGRPECGPSHRGRRPFCQGHLPGGAAACPGLSWVGSISSLVVLLWSLRQLGFAIAEIQ